MPRFSVIEVGCIECNGGGSSYPGFIAGYETLDEAVAAIMAWDAQGYHSDSDRFIVDSDAGAVCTPQRPKEDAERARESDRP